MAGVRDQALDLLNDGPRRYTEIMSELGRPDKTVYVTLRDLQDDGLVAKDNDGRYVLTDKGVTALLEAREVLRSAGLEATISRTFAKPEPSKKRWESAISFLSIMINSDLGVKKLGETKEKIVGKFNWQGVEGKAYASLLMAATRLRNILEQAVEMSIIAASEAGDMAPEKVREFAEKKSSNMLRDATNSINMADPVDMVRLVAEGQLTVLPDAKIALERMRAVWGETDPTVKFFELALRDLEISANQAILACGKIKGEV